ncbi:hypothetical protein BDBG_09552, partial [Blastomyces gilchristii SLH14081]
CIIMNDTSSSLSYILLTVFLLKSSYIDRSVSADDSELNVESLIENLKDAIMKELPVPCMTGSPASPPAPVFSSPAPATPVPATFTLTTPAPATSASPASVISAFIISSSHFKKMLCRLDESHFSV